MTNEKQIKSRIIKIIVVTLIILTIGFLSFNKGTISLNNLIKKAYQAEGDALELLDNASQTAMPSNIELEYVAYNNVARNYAARYTAADFSSCKLESSDSNVLLVIQKSTMWWIYTLDQGEADLVLSNLEGSVTYHVTINASLTSIKIVDPINNTEYPDNKSIPANSTLQLGLKTEPEDAPTTGIIWSSTDTSIMEVDQTGLVTTHTLANTPVTIKARNTKGDIFDTVTLKIQKIDATGVSISSTKSKYTIGETDKISATYTPDGASPDTIMWTSSNPSVMTVDNDGNISALDVGTTTISALVDGKINSNELELTVRKGVESVALSETKLDMIKDDEISLDVSYTPSNVDDDLKGVIFKSSSPTVATVDENGKVKAVGSGTAKITATSTTNANAYANCLINVTVPIKSIKVNPNKITLEKGKTETLNIEVNPSDTTDEKSFTYKSNNEDVATVTSSGKVKGVSEGSTTITVTHTASGLTAEANITVKEEPVVQNNTVEENTVVENTITENTITENVIAGNSTTENSVVDNNTVTDNSVEEPSNTVEPLDADTKSIVTSSGSEVNGKIQFDKKVDPEWELVIAKKNVSENLTNANVVSLYDIKIMKHGKEVPVEGQNMRITLQPDMNLSKYSSIKVGYVENDQLVNLYNASYDGTYVAFNTTHLSEYAVVATETDKNELVADTDSKTTTTAISKVSPQTGDINVTLYVIAAIGSLLGITFIIKYLKDRR